MVDKKIFKKEKIIVFGGSGFIGSHVAEALNEKGYRVVIADLKNNKINKNIKFKNYINNKKVFNLVKKASIVYNFAAIADIQDLMTIP